jgi:hypothetical protein
MKTTVLVLGLASCLGCSTAHVSAPVPQLQKLEPASPFMAIVASFENPTPSFSKYVVPHVSTFMVRIDWSQIELFQGTYNFDALDHAIEVWTSQGKQVILIVSLASDYGPNVATPPYVLKQVSQVTCKNFPDPNPITDEAWFAASAKPFIQATLKHLSTKPPLYVRFGFTGGGENFPHCWTNKPWPGGETVFMNYLTEMANFTGSVAGPVKVVANMDGGISLAWADEEAAIFTKAGLGIGIEALSSQDVTAYKSGQPCSGDWCALFRKYPSAYHYLQSAQPVPLTDPLTYVPFARQPQFKVDALELTSSYLSVAYDPTNANYQKYGAQFRSVLELP